MPPPVLYTFDEFELDTASRRLTRSGAVVPLSDRHVEVLLHLLSHAGRVLSKEALIDAAWPGVAVTDNSLEQAISALRRALGGAGGTGHIQTVPRQGYRFTGAVTKTAARETDAALDTLLAPHRAWIEGRAALETLSRERLASAKKAFARVLSAAPDYAPAHAGMANACALLFESTRADPAPDAAALAAAVRHAREACRLDPSWGEAWATLGFVLHRVGDLSQALAAARRALAIEPDNWKHYLRLAVVSWGEERLRAADRTLKLLPGLALAHWLAATVHIARQAFDAAERELDRGAASQDEQQGDGGERFTAVGLHWLRGLVRLRRNDEAGALASFERELLFEPRGHLYTRECCANTWYAMAALHLRRGDAAAAHAALDEALRRVPGHMLALALGIVSGAGPDEQARMEATLGAQAAARRARGAYAEAAMAESVAAAVCREHTRAVEAIQNALTADSAPAAAWTVPVDPVLRVADRPGLWAPVLAILRSRAA